MVVSLAVALWQAPAAAQQPASGAGAQPPAADTPVDLVEAGRKLYVSYCTRCHGMNMVTTGNSYDLRTFPLHDKERFVRSVSKGLRAMPAWDSTLTAADIDALWAYVTAGQGGR